MEKSNDSRKATSKKFTIPSLQQMEHNTPKPVISSHFHSHLEKKKGPEVGAAPAETPAQTAFSRTSAASISEMSSNAAAIELASTVSAAIPREAVSATVHSSPVKLSEYKGPLNSGSPNRPQKANIITVNAKQKGNPILKHIRNVPWEFGDIRVDYEIGKSACALYLSLRYHNLHPEYVHARMDNMQKVYELRVLLVQVDVKDPQYAIRELGRISILAGWTLILCWSPEEAGRYLETYKAYENKPADVIMEKTDAGYLSEATEFLTAVKSINKTDAMTLLSTFQSVAGVMRASREELELCPGLGPSKARRLFDALREPFLKSDKCKAEIDTGDSPSKRAKADAAAVPATDC